MKMNARHYQIGFLVLSAAVFLSCKKSNATDHNPPAVFVAGSTAFTNNGNYPKLYTCDSTGISPTLYWSGAPAGTTSYAITMHHIPPTGDKHVYIVLYDIPASVTSIPDAVSGIGNWGINTVNGQNSYTPPCSVGPGPKLYVITVYALSSAPVITVAPAQVTMDVLLNAARSKTLASSVINVTYSR